MHKFPLTYKLYENSGITHFPDPCMTTCSLTLIGSSWYISHNIIKPKAIVLFLMTQYYARQTHIITNGDWFTSISIRRGGLLVTYNYSITYNKASVQKLIRDYIGAAHA